MRLLNTNGQEYVAKLNPLPRGNVSQLHIDIWDLLKDIFKFDRIYHELPIKINNQTLYIDIFIPSIGLVVEVNGQQHEKFTKHFHKTKAEFLRSKVRDNKKKEWALINNLDLIVLNYDNKDEWRKIIERRYN